MARFTAYFNSLEQQVRSIDDLGDLDSVPELILYGWGTVAHEVMELDGAPRKWCRPDPRLRV